MAVRPDYDVGTVSVAPGGTTVTGVGSLWAAADINRGDTFKVKNLDAIIASVDSNTQITLKEPWTGGVLAASPYAIRYQPDGSRFTAALRTVAEKLGNGNLLALAGLTGALDKIPMFTGAGAMTLVSRQDLGDVSGPPSSSSGRLPMFTDNTGKVIGDSGVYAKTALQRNLIVNPIFEVSQENGSSASGAAFFYAADQWFDSLLTSGVVSFSRVASKTPRNSQYRLRMQVTTIDTSLAAGEVLAIYQAIEGFRLSSLGWGAAGATPIVLRFGFRGPTGTYSISIANGDQSRSYVTAFTVSAGQANTDIEVIKAIPADTTGTWNKTNIAGMFLGITLAAGATYMTAPDVWTLGNKLGAIGMTNGLGSAGTYELFDVGLYPDPDNAGQPPNWIAPFFADSLSDCLRYWQTYVSLVIETGTLAQSVIFSSPMRTAPTVTGGGSGFVAAAISNVHAQFFQTTRAYQTLTLNARM